MAGNIIHAIATTNAIVGGLIVVEAMKILAGKPESSKVGALLSASAPEPEKPSPRVYSLSDSRQLFALVKLFQCCKLLFRVAYVVGHLHFEACDQPKGEAPAECHCAWGALSKVRCLWHSAAGAGDRYNQDYP